MKLVLVLLLACVLLPAAEWDALERIAPDQKIEVTTQDGARTRAAFVRVSAESLTVRSDSGDRSFARTDVRQVRVAAPSRRVRNGLIWTGVGIAAGAGVGAAICPGCANEGAGLKYIGPGIAIGAAVGALGFLSSPYRVIYRSR